MAPNERLPSPKPGLNRDPNAKPKRSLIDGVNPPEIPDFNRPPFSTAKPPANHKSWKIVELPALFFSCCTSHSSHVLAILDIHLLLLPFLRPTTYCTPPLELLTFIGPSPARPTPFTPSIASPAVVVDRCKSLIVTLRYPDKKFLDWVLSYGSQFLP